MRTIDDVFDTWGTLTEMAAAVGENRSMVEKWKKRRRIPSDYWPALIRALRNKGHRLTGDDLLAMQVRARRTA